MRWLVIVPVVFALACGAEEETRVPGAESS